MQYVKIRETVLKFGCHIMRIKDAGRRRKRFHRINVTMILTVCPCDGMSFAGNGLQRV